jgi:hypothetical protein
VPGCPRARSSRPASSCPTFTRASSTGELCWGRRIKDLRPRPPRRRSRSLVTWSCSPGARKSIASPTAALRPSYRRSSTRCAAPPAAGTTAWPPSPPGSSSTALPPTTPRAFPCPSVVATASPGTRSPSTTRAGSFWPAAGPATPSRATRTTAPTGSPPPLPCATSRRSGLASSMLGWATPTSTATGTTTGPTRTPSARRTPSWASSS